MNYQPLLIIWFATTLAGCGVRSPISRPLGKHVDFSQDDRNVPFASQRFIYSRNTITPYEQWNSNNGYCGELSSIQAGMGAGQWMSQFNARLLCGAGLSQSGPNGFCAAHNNIVNYNAQFLFESPNPGDLPFASGPTCLGNAHLAFQTFDYFHQPAGMTGYRQFMTWVKARLIAGDTVAIGVLSRESDDPQYDHEVTVSKIGTNHAITDASYYEDDVLFFEDHGTRGTSFTRGYSFASLAKTRDGANSLSANAYSILIPGGPLVNSGTGGDGIRPNSHAIVPTNYGFAVSGPVDPQRVTLPVTLTIRSSKTNGHTNASRGTLNFNYETPEIGESSRSSCTNIPPLWMDVTLQATVSGLTPGVAYNLYEYNFSNIAGIGSQAALNMPDSNFNANASMASHVTRFVAENSTYLHSVEISSDQVIALRCVRADAP